MAVYFARAEGTDFVKIGFAVNVERRMHHVQAGCPYTLAVVRIVVGSRRTEAAYHAHFAEHHHARDWFIWTPSMATVLVAVVVPIDAPGSFAGLIDGLGGPTVVAARSGLPLAALQKMSQRNRISARHWPAFQQMGVPADKLIACELGRIAGAGT